MAPDLNVPDLAKVTLGDASRATPALAVLGNKLVLAWTGTDSPGHLNVMTSTDGYYFGGKVTLPELSIDGPALAAGGNRLFVAWTGTDSQHRLNVTSSIDGLAFPPANKVTLPDTAMFGPALAFMNGRVYLAWVGTDRRLNVTSSTDGLAFPSANKVTLDEQSDSQVGLCAANGTLYLVWQGTNSNSSINFRQSTDGRNWSNKITLRESSDCAPAVVQGHELVLAWTGRDARHALNRMHSPSGPQGLGDKLSLDDAATAGVALAGFQGKFFIAWAGTDRQHRLNVMVLMPDDPAAALLDQILQAYPQVGQAIQWQMNSGEPIKCLRAAHAREHGRLCELVAAAEGGSAECLPARAAVGAAGRAIGAAEL